ncbi:Gfo/Idh/MocA family oxidoreductase [candidate division KSB1 bacterium]|nr:Gfo/Idh/MocA family oxidoreductase [candidate division KSB1 bacterium]
MKRRQFIKKSIAGTIGVIGFPAIIPSSSLGRNGNVPPSDRITMGCIGLGGQGSYNLQAFLNKKQVQVIALCDVNKGSDDYDQLYQLSGTTAGLGRARQILEDHYAEQIRSGKYKGCSTYADFRELLARNDIDAVTVCTPDHWHGLISVYAAKAGKDIYCEKPLTNVIAEGRAVCDAVKRYGRVLQTGSHERSNHSVAFACELIRNGRIGKLHTIQINQPIDSHTPIPPQPIMPVPKNLDYDMWLGPTPWVPYTKKRTHFWWRYQLQYGGGEMTDRGAHIIDLAQLGNQTDDTGPIEISGTGEAPNNGLFDTFMKYNFECTYANGVKMIGSSNGERGLKFIGDDGWIFIHIHGGRLEASSESLLRETFGPNEIHMPRSPGHHDDFLNCIKTRRKPFATAEIGHRTATICHLINIALITKRKLKWDPVSEQITNDPEANKMISMPMRSPWHL